MTKKISTSFYLRSWNWWMFDMFAWINYHLQMWFWIQLAKIAFNVVFSAIQTSLKSIWKHSGYAKKSKKKKQIWAGGWEHILRCIPAPAHLIEMIIFDCFQVLLKLDNDLFFCPNTPDLESPMTWFGIRCVGSGKHLKRAGNETHRSNRCSFTS